MLRKHIFEEGYAYFITSNTNNNAPIFKDIRCCELLIKDFDYYRTVLNFRIYGYVIMPTHFHWIIHPSENISASLIMKKVKGHSSFIINKHLKRKGSLWQENYYDHAIRNMQDFKEKINYIHKNPVKDNLVERMEDYPYSSYRNYFLGYKVLLEVDMPV